LTFRKSRWDAIPLDEEFVGSCWAHVARLFQMIPAGLRLHYIPTPYLFKRTDNDSFMDKGIVNRYAIAIDGFDRLASACFPEGSRDARDVRRVVTNEIPPWGLLELKFASERERLEDVSQVDRLASRAYADRTARNLIYRQIYSHTPRAAYRAAQSTYRAAKSVSGSIRTRRRREPLAAAR
jgi:abequosyltransferase